MQLYATLRTLQNLFFPFFFFLLRGHGTNKLEKVQVARVQARKGHLKSFTRVCRALGVDRCPTISLPPETATALAISHVQQERRVKVEVSNHGWERVLQQTPQLRGIHVLSLPNEISSKDCICRGLVILTAVKHPTGAGLPPFSV